MEVDINKTWYHGSPLNLSILRSGSTITYKRELARIFSHKPTIVSVSDNGEVNHNGTTPGYLYIMIDQVLSTDVVPHPQTSMQAGAEWLTTRKLRLQLLCPTEPQMEERLTDEEYAELEKRLMDRN